MAHFLGNITKQPLTRILKNARRRKTFQIMNRGSIPEFAEHFFGISERESEQAIRQKGRCVYHTELLEKLFSDSDEAPILYSVFPKDRIRDKDC